MLDWLPTPTKIGMTPEQSLKAPLIGKDTNATAWFILKRENHILQAKLCSDSEALQYWNRPVETLIEENYGKPVVQLVYVQPKYQSEIKDKYPTSFCAQVILDALGPDDEDMKLRDLVRSNMNPVAAKELSDMLWSHGWTLASVKRSDFGNRLLHGAQWLRFWSDLGHGVQSWS